MRIILSVGSYNLLLPEDATISNLLTITESEVVEKSYSSSPKWRKRISGVQIELKVVNDGAVELNQDTNDAE